MTIEQAIREAILAIFSSPPLRRMLYLKGGAALGLMEPGQPRLSLDIDFSTETTIENPEAFFGEMATALQIHFSKLGLDAIDARHIRRPKRPRADRDELWGGWMFSFKLSPHSEARESLGKRIKQAIIPSGSNSSRIEIQLSEHEYCEIIDTINIGDVEINLYSPALMVLEKIRAICQQHPSYRYSLNKNRARDFFDIFSILKIQRNDPKFILDLAYHVDAVFEAKRVPLTILIDGGMFEPDFIDGQELGFLSVRDAVRGKVEDFSFYVEQLKILVELVKKARIETGK